MKVLSVVVALSLSSLSASAQEAKPCDPIWQELSRARETALADCLRSGGGCTKEFAARQEALTNAGECPSASAAIEAAPATPAFVAPPSKRAKAYAQQGILELGGDFEWTGGSTRYEGVEGADSSGL